MDKKNILYAMACMLMLIFIIGCTEQTQTENQQTAVSTSLDGGEVMKKAESKKEIIEFLQKSQEQQSISYYGGGMMREAMMSFDSAAAPLGAPMTKSSVAMEESAQSSGNDGDSYSGTNVQVAGVDEADFVKNDGKYIYTIVQDKVVIVDAYPAKSADVVSEIKLNGTPQQMFVNDDRLVVFVSSWEEGLAFAEFDFMPRPIGKQATHAIVYDITDRSNPVVVKDYDLTGNYYGSRMIGSIVYLIVQDYVYYADSFIDTPVLRESSKMIIQPDIFYFPVPSQSYNFNTVMSFDLANENEAPEAKSFMMGYSSTLYVSENAIYLASPKEMPYGYYESEQQNRFYDVVVPLLPQEAQNEISEIKDDSGMAPYEKWESISTVLESVYNGMSESDKKELMTDIEEALRDYDLKREEERRKTVIHKIAIDDGQIEYQTKGEVKGYLLNQFSMEEHNGNLRLATTVESWASDEYVQYNNVYVLNGDLKTIGSLEKIAEDERIYSARFIGDRLYMVTFKRIDPFFVIDLSESTPKILGELKLPGYSDYLHPYDENHVIGIGKETGDNEWGGVSTKGIKIALFDVSDVANPKNKAVYGIGNAGTESEALYDHKAILFDREKNLLVLPVREVNGEPKLDRRLGYYTQDTWQGAYVLTIDAEEGFSLRGKVTHSDGKEQQWWYYGAPDAVRRALYIEDVLYTISGKTIKANDLETVDEIAEVELPYEEPKPYEPTPYYGGVMVKGGVGVSEPAVASDAPSPIADE